MRRHVLLRSALLFSAICGLSLTAMAQVSAEFNSDHDGVRYTYRLTAEQLARTPEWHDDEPNPPLPVRQAKLVGSQYLRELFTDADRWTLSRIVLEPVANRWVYEVSFTAPEPQDCRDCISFPFTVVVTMDGKAVAATKSVLKPH